MGGMRDGSVDSIITDPPYGILRHKIETTLDIESFMSECHRVLKPRGFLAFFGRQPTLSHWNTLASEYFAYKAEIVWYKRQRSSPMGDIGRVHENISVWSKGVPRQFNRARIGYSDLKQSLADLSGAEGLFRLIGHLLKPFRDRACYEDAIKFLDSLKMGDGMRDFYRNESGHRNESATFNGLKKVKPSHLSALECALLGQQPQDVVSFLPHNKLGFDSSGEGGGEYNLKHPTVKPVQLMEWLIQLMTKEGETVLDPFLGTGATAIACQNLGRECVGIEIDKGYFKIAKGRLKPSPTKHLQYSLFFPTKQL
jgi:DNA modification methylase